MEDLDYGSLLIIVVFWLVVVLIIMIVVCRLKHMKNVQENVTAEEQAEPRRIIQIYYIENAEGSQDIPGHAGSILNKILPRFEDQHPPSYEEATVTSYSEMASRSDGLDGLSRSNETRSAENTDNGRLGSDQDAGGRNANDVMIVVDRIVPASQY